MDPLPPPGPPQHPPTAPIAAPPTPPPPDPRAWSPTPAGPPRRGRSPAFVVAAVVVGALVVVVLLAVLAYVALDRLDRPGRASGSASTEADQLLARARSYVAARQTVRWNHGQTVSVQGGGTPRDFAVSGTLESVLAKSVHETTKSESTATTSETLSIGTDQWIRVGPTDKIAEVKWRPVEVPTTFDESRALADMLVRVRAPVIEARNGDTVVLRTEALPTEYFFVPFGSRLETRRLRITMVTSGEVRGLEAQGAARDITYRYTAGDLRWDERFELAPPPDAALDPTPNIDEEQLGAFKDATVLVPGELYLGWQLASATVLDPLLTEEKCAQAQVSFANPATGDQLDVFSLPVSCRSERSRDARDVTVGGNQGWIGTKNGDTFAELVVGDTRVQFRTSLPPDQLLALLNRIVPFDPASPPPATRIPGRTS